MEKEKKYVPVKTIMWVLNREKFAEMDKFKKEDVLYNPERDGKNNRMCYIMEKQKFNRLRLYFEKKGDPITKDDLFAGSSYKNTVIFKAFNERKWHQIEIVCEKNSKPLTKDDVFNYGDVNSNAVIRSALYHVRLDKLEGIIQKSGGSFSREDFLKIQKDGLTPLHWAATEGRLSYIAKYLEKKGEPLTKADLFDEKCGISPFELSMGINCHQALGALDEIKAEIEKKDIIKPNGERKPLFDKVVHSWGLKRIMPLMEKEGIYLTREEILTDKSNDGETPLSRSVEGGFLKRLSDNLAKVDETIKREDFLVDCGYKKSDFMLLNAVFKGQLDAAQEIVKNNGEKTFSLTDIPADHPDIYLEKNFLKIFGIKGFSDKPNVIKQFWDKVPEGHKNKATETVYKRALRASMSASLNPSLQSQGR